VKIVFNYFTPFIVQNYIENKLTDYTSTGDETPEQALVRRVEQIESLIYQSRNIMTRPWKAFFLKRKYRKMIMQIEKEMCCFIIHRKII